MLLGVLLPLLFTYTRIGPAGRFWLEGKGGETFLTPTGKVIAVFLALIGMIVGFVGGLMVDARGGPRNDRARETS